VRSLVLLLILAVTSAQINDRDIRLVGRSDRQTDYNHQRDVADTLVHASYGWNSMFTQDPGDAMMVVYQMPADGIIKGVNVPVAAWRSGDQGIIISLHRLSYPFRADSLRYSSTVVDGAGWIGGYDMDSTGRMEIVGTTYSPGGTVGICDPGDSVATGAQDPLGFEPAPLGPPGVPLMGLVWPTDTTAATLDPGNHPALDTGGGDNWLNTNDYGTEPVFLSGEYVGILVRLTGSGGGDEPTGFLYQDAESLGLTNPWPALKFYSSIFHECDGTSGNGGWHIRHWVFDFEMAVLLTGDRAPNISFPAVLMTTFSIEPRDVSVIVTDDNPSGGPAGVASVELYYSTNGGVFTGVPLIDSGNDLYTGQIPGQPGGAAVEYYFQATDVEGNTTRTMTFGYDIFLPQHNYLFINNSTRSIYWVMYLRPDTPFDYWNYGVVTPDLLDYYDLVVEITAGGPAWHNNDPIRPWVETGGNYILAGDEWLGSFTTWGGDYMPGEFQYDILGILSDRCDISGGHGVSRLLTVAGDSISGALHTFLADSLDLNYDPEYELGLTNWLDGVTPVAGVNVAFYGLSGQIDSLHYPPANADTFAVGIYHTLPGGGKVVFLSFDPLATNTIPNYHWIGLRSFGPLQAAVEWVLGTTAIDAPPTVPLKLTLHQNYPNPFNPITTIQYELPQSSDVEIAIYNLLGRKVTTLISETQDAGYKSVQWNAANVPSGMYFYQIRAGKFVQTRKLVVLK